MSYTPGSKFQVTGENGGLTSYVMVLSENKVMFIGPHHNGKFMSLTDWLILAEGHEMQVNSVQKADAIWEHAKQKSGIDPPSLVHVDEYKTKLPELLVPPQHNCETCDAFEFSDCETEATIATAPIAMVMPSSPAAAPELTATPLAQSIASRPPELSAASPSSTPKVPELSAASPSSTPKVPELRFPPPLGEPAPVYPQRKIGDKLKWELNDETYRIVIFTEKGVLQVKSVTDGGGETHTKDCTCAACWEYNRKAPWRPRAPLAKAFFETEKAWCDSLPQGGKLLMKARMDHNWV
jgi:hypothetical protein